MCFSTISLRFLWGCDLGCWCGVLWGTRSLSRCPQGVRHILRNLRIVILVVSLEWQIQVIGGSKFPCYTWDMWRCSGISKWAALSICSPKKASCLVCRNWWHPTRLCWSWRIASARRRIAFIWRRGFNILRFLSLILLEEIKGWRSILLGCAKDITKFGSPSHFDSW